MRKLQSEKQSEKPDAEFSVYAFVHDYGDLVSIRAVDNGLAYVVEMSKDKNRVDLAIDEFSQKVRDLFLKDTTTFNNGRLSKKDLSEKYRKIYGRTPEKLYKVASEEFYFGPNPTVTYFGNLYFFSENQKT